MAERAPIIRIGVASLVVNAILVAAKLMLSFVTGSLALRADAVHSLVDVFASIALILGLVISERKSRDFPYGLYKVENLASAVALSCRLRDSDAGDQRQDPNQVVWYLGAPGRGPLRVDSVSVRSVRAEDGPEVQLTESDG